LSAFVSFVDFFRMFTLSSSNPLFVSSLFLALDPLEQFDVLTVPLLGGGVTNLSLLLGLNILIMAVWFSSYNVQVTNNYDFTLRSLYQLVRSMVRENLYIRKQQYFSVLFYLFFTLLIANLVGMIPYSFTVTSSFIVTFFIAMTHFVAINHVAVVKHGWQVTDLFLPSGAPLMIAPFLIFIEAVSYIARVFSLSIRLFANMLSGHALLKILIGFSWTLLNSGSIMILLAVFPWVIVTAIMFLELLIAFLQAYVFTILITLYINDVLNMHD
jgi:ATP synthase subunit 6